MNLVSKTGYDEGLLGLRTEAGSFGFLKNHIATGQVYGPLDLYLAYTDTRLDGYRVHGQQTRNRASTSFGYVLPGGTTLRLDWGFTHNEENLPGALTRDQFEANPKQRNPATAFANEQRNYDYTRGGFTVRTPLGDGQTLEGKLQLNYQDLDHPLSFAVIDQTTYNWSTELRYLLASTLFGSASRAHRRAAVLRHAPERQPSSRTSVTPSAAPTSSTSSTASPRWGGTPRSTST